jgi:hypothetical protein
MNTHTQTPPSVFGPAARHRLQLLFVNFESRRGCFTKLDSFSSWGLFFSIAQLLILMAALKSRFMNAMRSVPLFELKVRGFLELVPSLLFIALSAICIFYLPGPSSPSPYLDFLKRIIELMP